MKKDMASGYIVAVLEHLPGADLVLDPFHRVKWFNGKLSNVRPVRLMFHAWHIYELPAYIPTGCSRP